MCFYSPNVSMSRLRDCEKNYDMFLTGDLVLDVKLIFVIRRMTWSSLSDPISIISVALNPHSHYLLKDIESKAGFLHICLCTSWCLALPRSGFLIALSDPRLLSWPKECFNRENFMNGKWKTNFFLTQSDL